MEKRSVTTRLPVDVLKAIDDAVMDFTTRRRFRRFTRSDWIIQACKEKLDHSARSKKPAKELQP